MDPGPGGLAPFLHANPAGTGRRTRRSHLIRHFRAGPVNLCVHGGVFAAFNSGLWFPARGSQSPSALGWPDAGLGPLLC